MSRSLNPTRPLSSRLILEWDARMTLPASSSETRFASRKRRSWAPSRMRSAVGLSVSGGVIGLWTGSRRGPAVVTIASQPRPAEVRRPLTVSHAEWPLGHKQGVRQLRSTESISGRLARLAFPRHLEEDRPQTESCDEHHDESRADYPDQ